MGKVRITDRAQICVDQLFSPLLPRRVRLKRLDDIANGSFNGNQSTIDYTEWLCPGAGPHENALEQGHLVCRSNVQVALLLWEELRGKLGTHVIADVVAPRNDIYFDLQFVGNIRVQSEIGQRAPFHGKLLGTHLGTTRIWHQLVDDGTHEDLIHGELCVCARCRRVCIHI